MRFAITKLYNQGMTTDLNFLISVAMYMLNKFSIVMSIVNIAGSNQMIFLSVVVVFTGFNRKQM